MEQSKKIGLVAASVFYLIRHFHQIDQTCMDELLCQGITKEAIEEKLMTAGSKFKVKFASNPRDLLDKLNQCKPLQVIPQENNRSAHIYQFEEAIGWDSIIPLIQIPNSYLSSIQEKKRGEQSIRTIELPQSPQTNQLVAIIDSETNNVISFFPGCYAPPLPNEAMENKFFNHCKEFWDKHIFII